MYRTVLTRPVLLFGLFLSSILTASCGDSSPEEKPEASRPTNETELREDRRIHLMKLFPKGRFVMRQYESMVRIREDDRQALLMAPGRHAVFRDVPLYPGAHLEVEVGIPYLEWASLESSIEFLVHLRGADGESRTVLETSLDPRNKAQDRGWVSHRVPLPGGTDQGADVTLVFEAKGEGNARCAAFSRPTIDSEGRLSAGPADTLVQSSTRRDLLGEEAAEPVERDGVQLFGLEVPGEGGAHPALQIEPGREVGFEIEATVGTRVDLAIFLAGMTKAVTGELRYRLEWTDAEGQATELLQASFDLERLNRLELGTWTFEDTVALPEGATSGRLRFRVDGEVESGRAITGLTGLKILQQQTIQRRSSKELPNVIVMLVDTLRADHLGAYGYERDTSPVFDRLAEQGLLFESCIAQSSWTLPSTASVLTGLYPQTHGSVSLETMRLPSQIASLPESLLESGIATGAFIANCIISRANGFGRGFDRFEELCLLPAEELNAHLLDWIGAQGDRPFFAYLHYFDPHWPYSAPEPFTSFFDEGTEAEIAAGEKRMRRAILEVAKRRNQEDASPSPRWEVVDDLESDFGVVDSEHYLISRWLSDRWRDRYDAEIRYWDDQLGQLLEALEPDVLERTWVIIVSDHGEALGEHDYIGHGANLYDEQVRVPLLILPPGSETGTRYADPVELIDIAPTVREILRLEPQSQFVGESLLQMDESVPTPAFSVLNDFVKEDMAAVQFPNWKAIQTLGSDAWELYRIEEDPKEEEDLSGEESTPLAKIQESLERWLEETPRTERSSAKSLDASTEAMLRAMGYLSGPKKR